MNFVDHNTLGHVHIIIITMKETPWLSGVAHTTPQQPWYQSIFDIGKLHNVWLKPCSICSTVFWVPMVNPWPGPSHLHLSDCLADLSSDNNYIGGQTCIWLANSVFCVKGLLWWKLLLKHAEILYYIRRISGKCILVHMSPWPMTSFMANQSSPGQAICYFGLSWPTSCHAVWVDKANNSLWYKLL